VRVQNIVHVTREGNDGGRLRNGCILFIYVSSMSLLPDLSPISRELAFSLSLISGDIECRP
jgi:hypothetical protein